jgi:hypothetical protein
MEETKKSKGSGIVIFFLILAIAALIGMGYYIYTIQTKSNDDITNLKAQVSDLQKQNENYKETIDDANSLQSVSILDDVVQRVYNYVLKTEDTRGDYAWQNAERASFYRDTKVKVDDLNNIEKLVVLRSNAKEIKVYSNEIKNSIFEKIGINEEYKIRYYDTYEFSGISDVAKRVFNKSLDELKLSASRGCSWDLVPYEDSLYELNFEGGGMGQVVDSYAKIQKAEKEGDKLYIYDKYMYIDFVNAMVPLDDGMVQIYTSSNESEEIDKVEYGSYDSFDKEVLFNKNIEKLKTYKHTFEKNENGSYYWVSTEPVE